MAFKFACFTCVILLAALCTCDGAESLLCGPSQEVKLHSSGRGSAISLTLVNGHNYTTEPCALNIFAPDAYALSFRIIDTENFEVPLSSWGLDKRQDKNSHVAGKNKTIPDCTLQIFYLDSKKLSKGDRLLKVSPCSFVWSPLVMLPPPVRVEWWPARPPRTTAHLRLIITVINNGEICFSDDQIVCRRDGDDPLLCVSDALACDGVRHCPENGMDESSTMCNHKNSNWIEQLVRRLASVHGEFLGIDNTQFATVTNTSTSTTEPPKKEKKITALEAALAPYGVWGYLLIGTLICAVMMVFFALWECFCHNSKPPQVAIPPECEAPAAVILGTPQRPPRAMRSSRGSSNSTLPPSYDTLEPPPPPYSVLFPRANKVITTPPIESQGPSTSSLNPTVS